VINDDAAATAQALGIARDVVATAADGSRLTLQADTLCLHGDGASAVQLARRLRAALEAADVRIAAPGAA
jgi:UPF0271 protein